MGIAAWFQAQKGAGILGTQRREDLRKNLRAAGRSLKADLVMAELLVPPLGHEIIVLDADAAHPGDV